MDMNFDQCWDCPLGIRPAVGLALLAVFFLFVAVRLYHARTLAGRFVGGGAAAIAFLFYAGLAKYVGFHGLAFVTGPAPLPPYSGYLFLATWLAISALVFHLGRSRALKVPPAASWRGFFSRRRRHPRPETVGPPRPSSHGTPAPNPGVQRTRFARR